MQPHQQRVIDEKRELDEKATKLSEFIGNNPVFETLDAEDQELLREQCETMWEYSTLLGKRISRFVFKNSKNANDRGLIQLHWQNKGDLNETEMVCQGGDFESPEEMQQWLEEMVERFKGQCPDGWMPLVCDSSSEFFWWAASKSA